MTDDLSTPLGRKTGMSKRAPWLKYRLPFSLAQFCAVLLGAALLAFLGYAFFANDPLGGEPRASIAIDPAKIPAQPASTQRTGTPPQTADGGMGKPAAPPSTSDQRTVTIIDGSSGKRQEVVIPLGGPAGAAPSIAPGTPTAPAMGPRSDAVDGINPELLETSRYGAIPVTSKNGLKPLTAYARPVSAPAAKLASTPLIAIVVTGLGVSAARTTEAISRLPPDVTLGLVPYGPNTAATALAARKAGHEWLMQIPMEPFDYPDNDPGPQTLMTALTPDQNIDRLYWHMSRAQGYVGLTAFMGAKFTASDEAVAPLMKDVAKRGLLWLDDGTNARSAAPSAAAAQAVPVLTSDATLDTVSTPAEIDKALTRLETQARQRGVAIGLASTLPVSIERVERWAKTLDAKGLMLVPLTTALRKAQSS